MCRSAPVHSSRPCVLVLNDQNEFWRKLVGHGLLFGIQAGTSGLCPALTKHPGHLQVTKQVAVADAAAQAEADAARRNKAGLDSVLASLQAAKKVNVLDKSRSDWRDFKTSDAKVRLARPVCFSAARPSESSGLPKRTCLLCWVMPQRHAAPVAPLLSIAMASHCLSVSLLRMLLCQGARANSDTRGEETLRATVSAGR